MDPTPTPEPVDQERVKSVPETPPVKRGYKPPVRKRALVVGGSPLAMLPTLAMLMGGPAGRLMPLSEDQNKPKEFTKHDQERLDAAKAKRERKAARKP